MEQVKLDRLSELTHISRERELTEAEKRERETLRNEYRAAVTGNLRAQLTETEAAYNGAAVQVAHR